MNAKLKDPMGAEINAECARQADVALLALASENNYDVRDAAKDMLANLMHWSDQQGVDFERTLGWAREKHKEETEAA